MVIYTKGRYGFQVNELNPVGMAINEPWKKEGTEGKAIIKLKSWDGVAFIVIDKSDLVKLDNVASDTDQETVDQFEKFLNEQVKGDN